MHDYLMPFASHCHLGVPAMACPCTEGWRWRSLQVRGLVCGVQPADGLTWLRIRETVVGNPCQSQQGGSHNQHPGRPATRPLALRRLPGPHRANACHAIAGHARLEALKVPAQGSLPRLVRGRQQGHGAAIESHCCPSLVWTPSSDRQAGGARQGPRFGRRPQAHPCWPGHASAAASRRQVSHQTATSASQPLVDTAPLSGPRPRQRRVPAAHRARSGRQAWLELPHPRQGGSRQARRATLRLSWLRASGSRLYDRPAAQPAGGGGRGGSPAARGGGAGGGGGGRPGARGARGGEAREWRTPTARVGGSPGYCGC